MVYQEFGGPGSRTHQGALRLTLGPLIGRPTTISADLKRNWAFPKIDLNKLRTLQATSGNPEVETKQKPISNQPKDGNTSSGRLHLCKLPMFGYHFEITFFVFFFLGKCALETVLFHV